MDRSSSFQTSTDSPNRPSGAHLGKQALLSGQPDISSLSFYNQGLTGDSHANYMRKSIVVSPSWREIREQAVSNDSQDVPQGETQTADLSFTFENEIPTNTFGVVPSPSLQKLSDILTSKVSASQLGLSPLAEISEEGELGMKRNHSVNTFYTAQTIASSETFQATGASSTPGGEMPDLIDLASPLAAPISRFDPKHETSTRGSEHEAPLSLESPQHLSTSSSRSGNYNYTDIYEHYSPQRNPSVPSENKRISVMSEQLTLGNIRTPTFNAGFDAPEEDTDSVKEIGYDKDDTTTSDFSFVPSVREVESAGKRNNDPDFPFLHNAANRLSMRVVDNSPEKNSHFDFGLTPLIDVSSPLFNDDVQQQIQPRVRQIQPQVEPQPQKQTETGLHAQPQAQKPQPQVTQKSTPNTQQYSSLIDISPVKQPQAVMDQIPVLIPPPQPVPVPQAVPARGPGPIQQKQLNQPKQTPKLTVQQLADEKPKKAKLTFKGLFKRDEHTGAKPSRPKSFSFGNMETTKVSPEEKKEKSKSLLSSWKRKSLFSSSSTNIDKKELPKTPKTPKTPRTPTSPHKRTMSFGSLGKLTPRQLSPHRHSKSVPVTTVEANVGVESAAPSPAQTPLLASYKLDSTPALSDDGFNFNYSPATPNIAHGAGYSPDLVSASSPVIVRQASMQQFSTSSNDNFQEAQSGVVENESVEKVVDLSHAETTFEEPTPDVHTSSLYESVDELPQPPAIQVEKPVTPPSVFVDQFDATPVGATPSTLGQNTPASLTVASFTASPNKFHIGDDLFPKHLNANEIESIVTLERSRSMRSVRSAKSNRMAGSIRSAPSTKKSIVQIMQEQQDFEELVLPDGSVLVKSPSFPAQDSFSMGSRGSRGSILKPQTPEKIKPQIQPEDELEQELSDLIDMINFDDEDGDFLDTDFDIDMAFASVSPVRRAPMPPVQPSEPVEFASYVAPVESPKLAESPEFTPTPTKSKKSYSPLRQSFELPRKLDAPFERESSVPDFLGVDSDNYYDEDFGTFEAFESPAVSKVAFHQYDSPVEYVAKTESKQRQVSQESVEEIIRVEESYAHDDAFIPETNRASLSFKGLRGPTLRNGLKPSTEDAIAGSMQLGTGIVPSDSEGSLAYHTEYNDFANEYQRPQLAPPPTFVPVVTRQYQLYQNQEQSTVMATQSCEDLTSSPLEKSRRFMERLSKNDFAHLSTSSLPATTKPKKLNKRRNRSSASFGKLFGSKDSPRVQFSSRILLYETYGEDEYDREPEVATCNSLTPQLATQIKAELNDLKASMPVHEDSRCYTHFF